MDEQVKAFCDTYKLFEQDEVQQTQLKHRFALVQSFEIKEGMRVLEIGCGQGDTTVVLADQVGETGHVTAIDIAPGNYGAPMTLAEAHKQILKSPLGNRISFYLETDFLQFQLDEPVDIIVLSHCSWYFKSKAQLLQYFEKAKKMCVKLCFAEWDLNYTNAKQRSHFCAVSILALYSTFVENDGNVQHVWSKGQIMEMAKQAGFHLSKEEIVDASYLHDGSWERAFSNHISKDFQHAPSSIQALVKTYLELMNEAEQVESLNSFVVVFE